MITKCESSVQSILSKVVFLTSILFGEELKLQERELSISQEFLLQAWNAELF